jgi:hypothetical protein
MRFSLFNSERARLRFDTLVLNGVYIGIARVLKIGGFGQKYRALQVRLRKFVLAFSASRMWIQLEAEYMSAEPCLGR